MKEGNVNILAGTIEEEAAPSQNLLQGLSQQIHQEEEDDELTNKESLKRSIKEMRFHGHPDIVHVTKKKELDPDTPALRLLDGQDCSEDSDDDLILVPNKSHWLKTCLGIWGMEDDDALTSKVRDAKNVYEIFTAGFCSKDGVSGCGAIIRDSCHRPIVAKSKAISKGQQCVSPFYLELEGVALGVKLAKKYKVYPFNLYCPSEEVSLFVTQNWSLKKRCYCNGEWETVENLCKGCSKLVIEDDEDNDKAFEVILDIFSDISELESFGLPWFNVGYGGSERNEAADLVAQLGEDKDLKLKEIGQSERLWDAIYEEVFGKYIK